MSTITKSEMSEAWYTMQMIITAKKTMHRAIKELHRFDEDYDCDIRANTFRTLYDEHVPLSDEAYWRASCQLINRLRHYDDESARKIEKDWQQAVDTLNHKFNAVT